MDVKIEESWKTILAEEFNREYFAKLAAFVKNEYQAGTVYPPGKLIFEAFNRTPFDKVKVVIIGQDPYHEPGQAQGLAFYVPPAVQTPPSLQNIAKEIAAEYNREATIPNLINWADEGVLLLNATLTVRAHQAGSHQGKGWETFTDAVIKALAQQREGLVYLLWGSYAQKKAAMVDKTKNLVLSSAHPSPLSAYRGFFGCGHFKACNDYLSARGIPLINW